MLKSKITGSVQEVILPDFPDDDNTLTATVTKSRRVSFGTNLVKEFIVGSAVSSQCLPEYEQAFPSSDSSNADSSQSGVESEILDHRTFVMHEGHKVHKPVPPVEPDVESQPKFPKFSSTICFSADSPTADMEFTEGCITLAKSIFDKKNKEMRVIIQGKPKESKENEKPKEEETKYFDGSQFDMSVTRCLKSKVNKREEKKFESENTKIFSKYENEMSITRCNKIFNAVGTDISWEESKENQMPLDMIMRHLDKDTSDLENDLFNSEKTFTNFLSPFDTSSESEKLDLNESMEISSDFPPNIIKLVNNKSSAEQRSTYEVTDAPTTQRESVIRMDESVEKNCKEVPLGDPVVINNSKERMDIDESDCVLTGERQLFTLDVEVVENDKQFKEPFTEDVIINEPTQHQSLNTLYNVPTAEREPSSANVSKIEDIEEQFKEPPLADDRVIESKEKQSQEFLLEYLKEPSDMEVSVNNVSSDRIKTNNSDHAPTGEGQLSVADVEIMENDKQCKELFIQDVKINEPTHQSINLPYDVPTDREPFSANVGKIEDIEDQFKEPSLVGDRVIESTEKESQEFLLGCLKESSDVKVSVNNESSDPIRESDDLTTAEREPSLIDIRIDEGVEGNCKEVPLGDPVINNSKERMDIDESDCVLTGERQLFTLDVEVVENDKQFKEPFTEDVIINEPTQHQSLNTLYNVPTAEREPSSANVSKIEDIEEQFKEPPVAEDRVIESKEKQSQEFLLECRKESCDVEVSVNKKSSERISTNESDDVATAEPEPSLVDLKVIESLEEQSKEPNCVWSLKDIRHPQVKSLGWLSFSCRILESSATVQFTLKISNEDSLDSCSTNTNSEIIANEDNSFRLPEYKLVVDFGFEKLKKFFEERRIKVETIRRIPYFLDEINSFMLKTNAYLNQVYSILTLYPGSRLERSLLSFRLYSFPVFFSSVVSIDLSDLFRLSSTSLIFEDHFGNLNKNKIKEIFRECLKLDNSLCEFVVQSTKYIIDLEKGSGFVSKRKHIRLLPDELK